MTFTKRAGTETSRGNRAPGTPRKPAVALRGDPRPGLRGSRTDAGPHARRAVQRRGAESPSSLLLPTPVFALSPPKINNLKKYIKYKHASERSAVDRRGRGQRVRLREERAGVGLREERAGVRLREERALGCGRDRVGLRNRARPGKGRLRS